MSLWILEPCDNLPHTEKENPWKPWYDKAFGFIVRAENEQQARQLASNKAGDEKENVWLDSKFTTCEILESTGDSEVIMRDYASA